MSSLLTRVPEIADASVDEQLAMIDELWELVRRSEQIRVPDSHLVELDRRVALVVADPEIALTPAQARSLLKR